MQIKSRWNKRAKEQSIEKIAGALGLISWKIATNAVLELENKGYQTDSNAHRLQIIGEFLAFLLQVADRLAFVKMETDERQRFISALAKLMVETFVDNQYDVLGEGEHQKAFIELLNQRAEDYAELSFDDGEAGFDFRRFFGEQVAAVMREKHFVSQEVMDIEGATRLA
ncbi:hypothetical protein PN36_26170 [Candidatus Thiomargarita nelsonii]|uniref:Uncharacterized protein n=1 Tax=Candidatus Thiomargarita nelsonii TaxID=1003181 RepID=A0A0A6PJU0_9GAMM|nr:hypothetical protein PN36_26170 [Candidatus Thiomargarita nelsonii]